MENLQKAGRSEAKHSGEILIKTNFSGARLSGINHVYCANQARSHYVSLVLKDKTAYVSVWAFYWFFIGVTNRNLNKPEQL